MDMNNKDKNDNEQKALRLKIDAHVVRQLGAELISGPEIAILELVKNSFDADADYCYLSIQTNHTEIINSSEYKGKISILDNGHGMSRDVINKSWLTISHSEKRSAKSEGYKTVKHDRSFTGDKGLGRLGSMQLGRLCRIKTHYQVDQNGLEVYFDWSHFQQGRTLDSVTIHESTLPPKKKTSTEIDIVGLNDLSYWQDEKNLTKLKYKLSSMISPFGHLKDFKVFLNIEGIDTELETVDEKISSLWASQFDFRVHENKVITEGKLRLNNFTPANASDKDHFERYIKSDNGKGFFEYLSSTKTLSEYRQTYLEHTAHFVKFYREIDIEDISATRKSVKNKRVILGENPDEIISRFTHPGNFDGKIFQFVFKKDSLKLENLSFDDTKTLVQELTGGVAAYRDGFRIGSKRSDWLGLAEDMTSGGGAYSLRPVNTAGFINLTWENNSDLQEKSDRESFIENEAFEGFYILCQEIISSINNYLNKSRRASLDYIRYCNENEQGKPESYSSKHAIVELDKITKEAKKTYSQVKAKSANTVNSFKDSKFFLNKAIQENEQSLFHDPTITDLIKSIKVKTNELENQFSEYANDYEKFTKKLADHITSIDKIKYEIDNYEEQIKSFYDHVAIGLSAQALAHEANAQVNNIYVHLNSALDRVKELGIQDVILTRNLLSIRGDGQVLSKSISSLDPLVRAQRNIIEKLELSDEIINYLDLRINYFKGKGITIFFNNKVDSRPIRFNRGKLFQIIDNIVRNSEYWLEVFSTHNPSDELKINIELNDNILTIWDSGKGIRPPLEDILFDMFSSDKKSGQGLGLFIVRSLLEERGCSISLSHETNKFGRRFKFEIDFLEAME